MDEPEQCLVDLIAQYTARKDTKWDSGQFHQIKALSATEKGNISEDFAMWLAEWCGLEAERHKSRRGAWDIKIAGITLEVKTATEDVQGAFQFNGIRYDTKFDRLLVIAISPNRVLFNIYPRRDLIDMPLANMAKKTNATYKLTRRPKELLEITEFANFFIRNSNT